MIFAFSRDLIWLACQQILSFFLVFLLWVMYISIISRFDTIHPFNTDADKSTPETLKSHYFLLSSVFHISNCHLECHPRHLTCLSALLMHFVKRPRLSKLHRMRAMTPMPDCWLFHMLLCNGQPEVREWQVSKTYTCSNWVMPQKNNQNMEPLSTPHSVNFIPELLSCHSSMKIPRK